MMIHYHPILYELNIKIGRIKAPRKAVIRSIVCLQRDKTLRPTFISFFFLQTFYFCSQFK